MRNTTVHLPHLYLKLIDEIICEKKYPCLSEFIRVAIRKMLKRDILLLKNPRIEQNYEKIQALIAKKEKPELQKNLDQFKVILRKNSTTEKNSMLESKLIIKKQARLDRY